MYGKSVGGSFRPPLHSFSWFHFPTRKSSAEKPPAMRRLLYAKQANIAVGNQYEPSTRKAEKSHVILPSLYNHVLNLCRYHWRIVKLVFILSNFILLDPSRKQLDDENNNFFYTDSENCRTSSNTRRSFTTEHNGDFERILIESVRTLMNSGKCCVIVVPPQVISVSSGVC